MRLKEKLLTVDEENLINMHSHSPEWLVEKKLIDNEIVNLYKMFPKVVNEGKTNDEIASSCKGLVFTIGELQRYKSSISNIAKRVETKKIKDKKKKERENGRAVDSSK